MYVRTSVRVHSRDRQVDALFEAGVVSTWDDADLLAPVASVSRRARCCVGLARSSVARRRVTVSAPVRGVIHMATLIAVCRMVRAYVSTYVRRWACSHGGLSWCTPRAEVEDHAPHVPLHEGLEGAEWDIPEHDAEEDDDGDEGDDDPDGPDRLLALFLRGGTFRWWHVYTDVRSLQRVSHCTRSCGPVMSARAEDDGPGPGVGESIDAAKSDEAHRSGLIGGAVGRHSGGSDVVRT